MFVNIWKKVVCNMAAAWSTACLLQNELSVVLAWYGI